MRVISFDGDPYLARLYICGKAPLHYWPPGTKPRLHWLPFAIYLHAFLRPDYDRELHNHPWVRSLSFILSGGYEEQRRIGNSVISRTMCAGRVNVIRKDDFHRVVTLLETPTWTLFIAGRKVDTWGFWNQGTGEYLPWREFEARRYGKQR